MFAIISLDPYTNSMKLLAALTLEGPDGNPVEIVGPGSIPSGGTDIFKIVTGNAISIFFAIAVLLALFYLVYGGIQWTMSGGDKQKIAAARSRLIYAIVGLVIIFFSIFIVNFVLFILRQNPI